MKQTAFTAKLMQWDRDKNVRAMPWKNEKDPYKVWISEVILQQTRVEQGWNYYNRFIAEYPTVQKLAAATDESVFKLWEGLGYYSRCRNLLYSARYISEQLDGKFPETYHDILQLKGIGDYTAAAIASFCFNHPHAVVDGNVLRVLSRIFGIKTPADTSEGKKYFRKLADEVLDKTNPGRFNQAIMDFGATVCKPAPDCNSCDLKTICRAFERAEVNALPVKEKKIVRKTRWFTYFIVECGNRYFMRKREEKDIWQGLFEFYLNETASDPGWNSGSIALHLQTGWRIPAGSLQVNSIRRAKRQTLTHQHIEGYFIHINLPADTRLPETVKGTWVERDKIGTMAFPGFINQFLKQLQQSAAF